MEIENYKRAYDIQTFILPYLDMFTKDIEYLYERKEEHIGTALLSLLENDEDLHQDFLEVIDKYIAKYKKEFDKL